MQSSEWVTSFSHTHWSDINMEMQNQDVDPTSFKVYI